MAVKPLGSVMLVSSVQLMKALPGSAVTLEASTTLAAHVQLGLHVSGPTAFTYPGVAAVLWNALTPGVTPDGTVICGRLEQPLKAPDAMLVTDAGIVVAIAPLPIDVSPVLD